MKEETKAKFKQFWEENKDAIVGITFLVMFGATCGEIGKQYGKRNGARGMARYIRNDILKNADREIIRIRTSKGCAVLLPHQATENSAHYLTFNMNGASVGDIIKPEMLDKFKFGTGETLSPDFKLTKLDFIQL